MTRKTIFALLAVFASCFVAGAQKYKYVDKSVAVVGNEVVLISDI